MQQRLQHLHGIPFRAILTLNFDGVIQGDPPEPNTYREVLRHERSHWWQKAFWSQDLPDHRSGPPTIKLHGSLLAKEGTEQIVFTREDYRRRLYRDAAYVNFLRMIFSTSTLLYLGVSFEDAYLNELRSEVLSLLGYGGKHAERPLAFALLADVDPAVAQHYRRHEAIEVIPFDSSKPKNFEAFDQWLKHLYDETSPMARLGTLLSQKRILWMDPTPDALHGASFLTRAASLYGRGHEPIVLVDSANKALHRLREAHEANDPFDLVISYWGGSLQSSEGLTLLQEMRRRDLRSPIVIFAGKSDADERKRLALSLGALHYCVNFETLFMKIEEIFSSAEKTW
jgi:hypothetical protein